MATIAVVTSSPQFAEGGHLVMARELVRALREGGHQAGLVVTPQNRFGQQGSAYLAAWCTDVQLAHEEVKVDQVISLRFPGYAVQHPRHVLWLNHRMREYYDLWEQFSSHLSWKGKIKERTRRAIVHRVDKYLFERMQRRFVISGTVQQRLRRFGGIESEVLYPPPPCRDYRHDYYGDYLFGVGKMPFPSALKPLFAIPTTCGTGSEISAAAVITDPDTHYKHLMLNCTPMVAILDPNLVSKMPAPMLASYRRWKQINWWLIGSFPLVVLIACPRRPSATAIVRKRSSGKSRPPLPTIGGM